jgi:hypothetical protein
MKLVAWGGWVNFRKRRTWWSTTQLENTSSTATNWCTIKMESLAFLNVSYIRQWGGATVSWWKKFHGTNRNRNKFLVPFCKEQFLGEDAMIAWDEKTSVCIITVNSWSKDVLEKVVVAQPVKYVTMSIKESATGHYPEKCEFSPHSHTFSKLHFNIILQSTIKSTKWSVPCHPYI